MKILIIANKMPYPLKDGGAIATFNMIKGLSINGVDVALLAMNTPKHNTDVNILRKVFAKYGVSNIISVDINTNINIFSALRNVLFSDLPYNAERFVSDDFEFSLIKLLSEESFDVIQLEGLYLAPYISVIRKYSDAKLSMRAHNIEQNIWHLMVSQESNLIKKWYKRLLANRIANMERQMINKYDLLVPITQADATVLNGFGNTKPVQVCPFGMDVAKEPPTKKGDANLFQIGGLDWMPNQDGILWFIDNCWDKIRKIHPNLEFFIAGRNAPENFVNRIKKQGINYVGEVENASQFINNHGIMIVPLLSGSGMRIKIIEGMALAKAIVSTPTGAEGITCTNHENILLCKTADEFVEAVSILIDNETKRTSIGVNAHKLALSSYDNSNIIRNLIQFYKNNTSN